MDFNNTNFLFFPLSRPFLPKDAASFQMNDSSYDSLENELNDEPESPYQEQLPLRDKDKPDSCSRDSVITLSDCDPDLDQEADLQLPPLARPRRFSPAVRQHRSRQVNGTSLGSRRLRRSSEPALTLANTTPPSGPFVVHASNHCPPLRKASYDAAIDGEREEGEDEVFLEQALNGLQLKEELVDTCEKAGAKVQNGGRRKSKHAPPPPLRLDASCSSLSSPATSPTGSSLSSLDSAFSQYSTDYASNAVISLAEPPPPPPPLSPLLPGRPQQDATPQHPPPSRSVQNNSMPQPSTWLKKGCRRSLKQRENGHAEDNSPAVNGKPIANCNGCAAVAPEAAPATPQSGQRRLSSPPSYQQALLQLQRIRSPFYRGSENPLTVRELRQLHHHTCTSRPPIPNSADDAKTPTGSEVTQRLTGIECVQPPQGVFYGQGATALVLQRQKSNSLSPTLDRYRVKTLPLPRRASEPAKVPTNPSYTLSLNRSRIVKGQTQEGGLRVSDVEPNHQEAHYCLSPSATRAVRDYFSSQDRKDSDACLRRSQEVALAIVQGKREWQSKRCSDPRMDDFEKLFFAEESYV